MFPRVSSQSVNSSQSTTRQGLICTEIFIGRTPAFSPRVMTCFEPAIQYKTSTSKNKHATLMSSEPGPIWSRNTGHRILSVNDNTDVQYQRRTYAEGATLLFFKVLGLASYGQSRDNQNVFRSMGYQIVWGYAREPSARRSSALKYTK